MMKGAAVEGDDRVPGGGNMGDRGQADCGSYKSLWKAARG